MKRSNSGFRELLDISEKGLPRQVIREYPPIKRTIKIHGTNHLLQFPYVVFSAFGTKTYGMLRAAMAKKPITNIKSRVYFPGFLNVYPDEGLWRVCGCEVNGVSIKNLNRMIDIFWSSGFSFDSNAANSTVSKLYGTKFHELSQKATTTQSEVIKKLAGTKRRVMTFGDWLHPLAATFYGSGSLRELSKEQRTKFDKQLKQEYKNYEKSGYTMDLIIKDVLL